MSGHQAAVIIDHPCVIARDIRDACSRLGIRQVTAKGGKPLETLPASDLELIRSGLNRRLGRIERRQRRWTSLCNEGTMTPPLTTNLPMPA